MERLYDFAFSATKEFQDQLDDFAPAFKAVLDSFSPLSGPGSTPGSSGPWAASRALAGQEKTYQFSVEEKEANGVIFGLSCSKDTNACKSWEGCAGWMNWSRA